MGSGAPGEDLFKGEENGSIKATTG